jgi:hypothetical protein
MAANGYTNLASLMGQHPEVAFLRRFGTLNMQTLLYLQAELVSLELKLKRCSNADKDSGHIERTIYDRDWQTLSESARGGGHSEQWETILSIRRVLKEYSESYI